MSRAFFGANSATGAKRIVHNSEVVFHINCILGAVFLTYFAANAGNGTFFLCNSTLAPV